MMTGVGLVLDDSVDLTRNESLSVIEVSGVLKWFDSGKGYGFIVPDLDLPDVLVHITCLRHGGYCTIYPGSRIVCEALKRPRGLQASRIISIDDSTVIHPSRAICTDERTAVVLDGALKKAEVKWFDRIRGYGFLTVGLDYPDIFVHMELLRRYGFTELCLGQVVWVRCGIGSKGLSAAEIFPDGQCPLPPH